VNDLVRKLTTYASLVSQQHVAELFFPLCLFSVCSFLQAFNFDA
jgi:hypothetical protein